MIGLDHLDAPTSGTILVGPEIVQPTNCPVCGLWLAFKRNTPEGWLTYCINGCNGRRLGVKGLVTA